MDVFNVVQQGTFGSQHPLAVVTSEQPFPVHFGGVFSEGMFVLELFIALRAGKIVRVAVPSLMRFQQMVEPKFCPADVALVHRLQRPVYVPNVHVQIRFQFVACLAVFTAEFSLALAVSSNHVISQRCAEGKLLAAQFANVCPVLGFNVDHQSRVRVEPFRAVVHFAVIFFVFTLFVRPFVALHSISPVGFVRTLGAAQRFVQLDMFLFDFRVGIPSCVFPLLGYRLRVHFTFRLIFIEQVFRFKGFIMIWEAWLVI